MAFRYGTTAVRSRPCIRPAASTARLKSASANVVTVIFFRSSRPSAASAASWPGPVIHELADHLPVVRQHLAEGELERHLGAAHQHQPAATLERAEAGQRGRGTLGSTQQIERNVGASAGRMADERQIMRRIAADDRRN